MTHDRADREAWTVYDADRIPTGATMYRGDAFRPGDLQLVVHVCVFDGAGRLLLQRRAEDKQLWPGRWDVTAGGAVHAGETSAEGAQRELFEEMGLELDLSVTRPAFAFHFRRGFDDFYLVTADPRIEDLAVSNPEVTAARWATRKEVRDLGGRGEFVPYRASAVDLVFDMVGREDVLDSNAW